MKKNITFDKAICYAKRGYAIRRRAWSKNEYLIFSMSCEYDEFVLSYVSSDLKLESNYIAFHKDIVANDWEIYLGSVREGFCIKEITYEV